MPNPTDERTLARIVDWTGGEEEWAGFRAEVFAEHFGPLMDELELPDDELFERLGPLAPVVLGAVTEDFLSQRFGDDGDRNPVDEYLTRRGWLEKKQTTAYLRAVRDSTPSLYEVVALDPGRAMTVRDLVRETDPVRVPDIHLSETLALWDCCVGRLVGSGRARRFGVGLLPYPRALARKCQEDLTRFVKDLLKRLRKEARKRGETLEVEERDTRDFLLQGPGFPVFFTHMFVSWHLGEADAPRQRLRNTDDEPLVLSTVRFPITGSDAEAAAALDDVPELDRTDADAFRWSWRGRALPALQLPKEVVEADPEAGNSYLSLGEAEIRGGALLLRVNSVERAGRGRELLAARLGSLLGNPLTSHEDPAESLGNPLGGPPAEPEGTGPPSAIAETVLRSYVERHYRRTLDEPLPVLGNRSPRRVAKTRKGRAAVVEWLKGIENTESRAARADGRRPVDLSWLWEELGIPRPGGSP